MSHRLAPDAAADLDHIWYNVALGSDSIARADRLVDAITERFYLLSLHPRIGRTRDDLRPGLRSFAVVGYVILYRIEGEDVVIVHVLHGRQDIPGLIGG